MYKKPFATFQARRVAIMKAHLVRDKDYKALRRARRNRLLLGTVNAVLATGLMLGAIKAAAIATHGTAGYAQIVAPVVTQFPADHLIAQALLPDDITSRLADMLRPYLGAPADLAFGPPAPVPAPEQN